MSESAFDREGGGIEGISIQDIHDIDAAHERMVSDRLAALQQREQSHQLSDDRSREYATGLGVGMVAAGAGLVVHTVNSLIPRSFTSGIIHDQITELSAQAVTIGFYGSVACSALLMAHEAKRAITDYFQRV